MKKVLASVALIFLAYSCFAQKTAVFENATNVINLGIGLGDPYWGNYANSGAPVSFNASYDRGVTDKLGIGYIGAGGIIGYTSRTYKYTDYKWKNSALLMGGRASYHFALSGEIGEKFDPYAGVMLGYVITSSSTDAPSGVAYNYSKSSSIGAGAFAGAHYYFTPNFGVYAEVGYQIISILNTGITFKF
jgi:hypothetical protein